MCVFSHYQYYFRVPPNRSAVYPRSAWRIPRPYSPISRPEPLLFLPSRSSIVLTSLSGPVSDSLLLRKSGRAGNRTRTPGTAAINSDHLTSQRYLFVRKISWLLICSGTTWQWNSDTLYQIQYESILSNISIRILWGISITNRQFYFIKRM
jgi:hypothetical protein